MKKKAFIRIIKTTTKLRLKNKPLCLTTLVLAKLTDEVFRVPHLLFNSILMEYQKSVIDPLIERAKEFGEVQLELIKLKSIHKAAELGSLVLAKMISVILFLLFLACLNIAIAFWLGDFFGKTHYGFLAVAGFYGLIALIFISFRSLIKRHYFNSIIRKLTSIVWKK